MNDKHNFLNLLLDYSNCNDLFPEIFSPEVWDKLPQVPSSVGTARARCAAISGLLDLILALCLLVGQKLCQQV